MARQWRRIRGILDELINNSFQAGATVVDSRIEDQGDQFWVCVKDNGRGMSAELLEKARKLLSQPRRHEMEEYYGNLAGRTAKSSGLTIIGMMTDDFTIDSTPGEGTLVKVCIKKDS